MLDSWGSYVGHGGDTYGFLSESGVLREFNASFSATANEVQGIAGHGGCWALFFIGFYRVVMPKRKSQKNDQREST